jgi:hypothetical protein
MSNLGLLIMGVGAAWSMTQMTSSASMVALVQTALTMPVAFISTLAGAIADMFDRRIVGLVALAIALLGAILLTALAWLGVMTPNLLLGLCFMVGSGMALFGPAWQASVSEQVPAEALPSAVALNSISYNIARSFGPAIGGVIVASAGAIAAFATNAFFYLPLMVVLFLWRRANEPSRLPPERLARAVISGVRYILNSPSIRVLLDVQPNARWAFSDETGRFFLSSYSRPRTIGSNSAASPRQEVGNGDRRDLLRLVAKSLLEHLGDVGHPVEIAGADEPLPRCFWRRHCKHMEARDVAHVDHVEAKARQNGDRAVQQFLDRFNRRRKVSTQHGAEDQAGLTVTSSRLRPSAANQAQAERSAIVFARS